MRTMLAIAPFLSIVLTTTHTCWSQIPPVSIGKPPASFEGAPPKALSAATFDLREQKLIYLAGESDAQGQIPINARQFPWAVQQDVPYRIDVESKPNGDVVLANPRLELLARWQGAQDTMAKNAHYAHLNNVLSAIPKDALWVPENVRFTLQQATVAAVVNTAKTDEDREFVVDLYYLQSKSYHGNKQIPYSVFEQARSACIATCAIRRKGKREPHGSGVLIGRNLVLTCKHNFDGENRAPRDCEVLFHFTDKDPGAIYAIKDEFHSSGELDYSLIELGDCTRASNDPDFRFPNPPRLGIEPELELNAPIYVSGHPAGRPLSVALNAQVVFPHRLKDEESLTYLIGWALLRMFETSSEYLARAEQHEEEVKRYLTSNYRQEGAGGLFFQPGNRPTIGADPDTKHGNSGGPAFDVERNAVVGILRDGAPDDAHFPAGASYANYEAVIPISRIVADLDVHKPGWKNKFNVLYYGE